MKTHWMGPARYLDDRAVPEVVLEDFSVERGGHEDQLQVFAKRKQGLDDHDQKVGEHVSLVHLGKDFIGFSTAAGCC